MKNLIIKKDGVIIEFREGLGYKIEDYRWVENEGFTVETTDDTYIKRWNKWYISEKAEDETV